MLRITLAAVAVLALCGCASPGAANPPPGAPGGMCGGIAGIRCGKGYRCLMSGPAHPDQSGVCRADAGAAVCPMIYRPVCGANGQTYSNACVARSRGAAVAREGEC